MATEDKYGPQLQAWFEKNTKTEGRSASEAQKAIGCSRQRVYQWLATGATDVVEVDRNTRGAAVYQYIPGTKQRSTVGPRGNRTPGTAHRSAHPAPGNKMAELVAANKGRVPSDVTSLLGHDLRVTGIHLDSGGVVLDVLADDGRELQLSAGF